MSRDASVMTNGRVRMLPSVQSKVGDATFTPKPSTMGYIARGWLSDERNSERRDTSGNYREPIGAVPITDNEHCWRKGTWKDNV